MSRFIFSVTAGRTGTAWVANFLRDNLGIRSIHEPLGIDDFGNQMPDIRTMRTFNERGLTDFVREFWDRKFAGIAHFPVYAESNHTLAKCGLLEYAGEFRKNDDFIFLCIRRNHVDLCLSYLKRGDFQNITVQWQWLLNTQYKRIIVNPQPLLRFGHPGKILWYIFEIEARQEYYKTLYREQFQFVDLDLELMTQADGARELLASLGVAAEPRMSGELNASKVSENLDLHDHIATMVSKITFDPREVAQHFVSAGRRLGDARNN